MDGGRAVPARTAGTEESRREGGRTERARLDRRARRDVDDEWTRGWGDGEEGRKG